MPLEWTIREDDAGLRVDKFLRRELPEVPRSHLYKLLRKRKVRLNDRRAHPDDRLAAGDRLVVRGDPERLRGHASAQGAGGAARPGRRTFEVLREDEHLLVVTKPAGLAIHPGTGIEGETLVDQVRAHLERGGAALAVDLAGGGRGFRPSPAHRLDRYTSGVVLVAKTRRAMVALTEAFTDRRVEKTYLALVKGTMPGIEGAIDLALSEHEQSARSKAEHGRRFQAASTRWRRLASAQGTSLLEVRPGTGRTHQIRRHLAAIAHPIVGDRRYGDFPFNREARVRFGIRRQLLHALRLSLAHPVSGERLDLLAPLPEDFAAALGRLGIDYVPPSPRGTKRPEPASHERS